MVLDKKTVLAGHIKSHPQRAHDSFYWLPEAHVLQSSLSDDCVFLFCAIIGSLFCYHCSPYSMIPSTPAFILLCLTMLFLHCHPTQPFTLSLYSFLILPVQTGHQIPRKPVLTSPSHLKLVPFHVLGLLLLSWHLSSSTVTSYTFIHFFLRLSAFEEKGWNNPVRYAAIAWVIVAVSQLFPARKNGLPNRRVKQNLRTS